MRFLCLLIVLCTSLYASTGKDKSSSMDEATASNTPPSAASKLPDSINQFTQERTLSGGTQSTFLLKDKSTGKPLFVLKKIAQDTEGAPAGSSSDTVESAGDALRIDQFKEEILADAIYQAIGDADESFGIHVPEFKIIGSKEGGISRVSRFLPGKELGFQNQAEVAKGFVVDAFMANWDAVIDGKNLWLSRGKVYRIDNGGALRRRAKGELKTSTGYDFSSAVSDLYTLRGQRYPLDPSLEISTDGQWFYGALTQSDILRQIERLVALEEVILETADACNKRLTIKDYPKLRSNLVTRLNSLKSYYYDQAAPVNQYMQAHPFAVVIPNKSSASILIVTEHAGKKKILLGRRIRHTWWGNFGGKADDEDKTLLNAAAREVKEESMGLYHVLADDLVKAPFHDLIKGGDQPDALHRMYLLEDQAYIDPATFNTALGQQTAAHSQEYTDFAWVDVADLLALVKTFQKTPNQTGNENQYVLKDDKRRDVSIHHPLMDMLRQEPVVAWLEDLALNGKVGPTHTQGSIGSTVLRDPRHSCWYPSPPFFDPRAEEGERLYNLTTKHLDLMTKVKQRGEKIRETLKPAKSSMTSANASSSSARAQRSSASSKEEEAQGAAAGSPTSAVDLSRTETATDTHLKLCLGTRYIQDNDQQNIYLFLRDVSPLSKDYCEEFLESGATGYKTMLLAAMAEERNMKDWFVFYHTLQGKMAFIYDIATEFRNALRVMRSSGDARENLHSLRALDTFFKDLADVDAFIDDQMKKQNTEDFTAMDNYKSNFQENGLSANIYLFGNPRLPGSSTFDLLYRDSTVVPPDYSKFLSHLISKFGLTNTDKYFELFKRYFGETDTNQLLQIFINPDVVDDIVYLSGTNGVGLYESPLEQKQKLAPKVFLGTFRQDWKQSIHALIATKSKVNLQSLQARIFLKPEIMADSGKVKIKRYFRVNPKEGYLKELRAMVREDLTHWLQAKHELSPDTLENPSSSDTTRALTPLQKVHRHMHQSSGVIFETKTAASMYGQFLRTDNLDGIKQILAQDPNFNLFNPIANVDYKDTKGSPRISPVLLLDKESKTFAWMAQNQLPKLIKETLKTLKEPSYIQGLPSQPKILALLEALFEKNQGVTEALAAASEENKGTATHVSNYTLALFGSLIKKNQGVTEAIAVASKAIEHGNDYGNAVLLFSKLFEKNQGVTEALIVASKAIKSTDENLKRMALDLFEAIVNKSQGVPEALTVALEAIKSTDKNIKRRGFVLFEALVSKNQGVPEALLVAPKAIKSPDEYNTRDALELFCLLVNKNQGVTEALAAATLLRESDDRGVDYAVRTLLRTLQLRGVDTTNIKSP